MLQPIALPKPPRSAPPAAAGKNRSFNKRESLFRAGDPATQIYEVVKGSLFIYKLLSDGRRQVVELVRPGDICGFADGPEHDSDCEALEAGTFIAHERISIQSSPALQQRLLRQLDRRVSALHHQAVTLGRRTATERVASLIMQLVSNHSPSQCPIADAVKGEAAIHMPMTRGEIADYLGLTLETVCRTLTDLERRNYIRIGQKRGEITITSVCRLCRLAKTDVCMNG